MAPRQALYHLFGDLWCHPSVAGRHDFHTHLQVESDPHAISSNSRHHRMAGNNHLARRVYLSRFSFLRDRVHIPHQGDGHGCHTGYESISEVHSTRADKRVGHGTSTGPGRPPQGNVPFCGLFHVVQRHLSCLAGVLSIRRSQGVERTRVLDHFVAFVHCN